MRAARGGHEPGAAVVMMDLDGFKEVNDSLGHQQGDLLLKEVAARLRTTVGDRGVVARLGGDEFAVLLAGCADPDEALALAQQVLRALEQPVPLQDIEVDIAGLDRRRPGAPARAGRTALLKRSDMAMYAAKADQRGVPRVRPGARHQQPAQARPRRRAARGPRGDAVEISVQPQADLATGEVRRVEVLARWEHPVHGRMRPTSSSRSPSAPA